ncbi:MAG: arsenate reductase [Gammaproteobacteria bacterium]|nr:arsenate reductase [Gammaproteobacteria bacterium]
MYKRRARIVFLCAGNPARALMAQGYAGRLGAAWLEARAVGAETGGSDPRAVTVMAEDGVDISTAAPERLTPELLSWADRVVMLCGPEGPCPGVPPGVPGTRWRLGDIGGALDGEAGIALRAVRDEIKRRVQGMIGGMRLLAASDSEH